MARHGRLRQTGAAASLAKGLAMLLGTALVSVLVFGAIVYTNLRSGVETFEIAEEAPVKNLAAIEGGVNFLLVGSDDRTGQGAEFGEGSEDAEGVLNDVTMVLHLSEDHKHATVVSIPRDTLVDTPTCISDEGEEIPEQYGVQFNSLLGSGGMNCVISTVEHMSGLDIQFAAMVKFRGVIEMSNAVGGVEVCVEQPIDDPYIGLQLDAGYHTLKGADALAFLRTRHGVGDGSDLSRISNQQVFLSALMRTLKSSDTLTDPTKLYGIARAATQNMVLSSNLNNLDVMVQIAVALSEVPLDQISFVQLPVVTSDYDANRVVPDEYASEALWELLRNDRSPNVAPKGSEAAGETDAAPEGEAGAEGETGAEGEGAESEDPAAGEGEPESSGEATPDSGPTLTGQTADDVRCSNSDSIF
ncbi:LCP family protein [Gulosibacter hominis]|uniref:LCP family protein n=1 Tax=Gulosibacter hominis TaxID=2770504 RepID=UPI00191907D7|nr:LCP family protein [Gulosibacter hominis]